LKIKNAIHAPARITVAAATEGLLSGSLEGSGFILMLVGMWFGAVSHYLLVYLPSVSRTYRNSDQDVAP
jgi:hypothetical protein